MNNLTVTKIVAENVLKFEQFTVDNPGKLTVFRGANNQGKTSALRLLQLAVAGSDNPQAIIHDGAAKGAITLGLSNGYTLRRSFTEKSSYLDLVDERGHKVPRPQEHINRLLGEYRDFNPLAWLTMPAKDQVRVLLQAIDVRLTPEEFTAATGEDTPFDVPFEDHGLVVLDRLRDLYAEERKLENKLADQKKKAAAEARAQLPAERPTITEARRTAADEAMNAAKATVASLQARQLAARQHGEAVSRLEQEQERERQAIEARKIDITELREEIRRIEAKIERKQQQNLESTQRIDSLRCEIEGLAASAPPTADERNAAQAALSNAELELRAIAADERTIAQFFAVEALEGEAERATERAAKLDGIVKTITGTLREQLLAKAQLPVASLAIEDGRIYVDGHPLDQCAESQQMRVAVAIARALSPALKVIVLDGTERMDATTFAAFLDEIRGDGFRYFASEVDRDGGALEIVMFGDAEESAEEAVA